MRWRFFAFDDLMVVRVVMFLLRAMMSVPSELLTIPLRIAWIVVVFI